MRPRSFFTTVFTFLGVFFVLFSGGSYVNAQEISRRDVMQQINARSDAFRRSAGRMGWDETSARQILEEGWDRLTNPASFVDIPEGSDAEFMLNALESLGRSEAVDRALAFVLEDCAREISFVALGEQYRRAALGSLEDEEAALDILADWCKDSEELLLQSVNDSRQPKPTPFDPEDFPSVAAASSTGSANDFHSFLFLSQSTPNALDGVCVPRNGRLPEITFFSLAHPLSAGRKAFLLI